MFKIILDEQNGADVKLEDGSYTLEIPPEGILKIKSFKPFDAWHESTARYKGGKEIAIFGSPLADDATALRDVGTQQRGNGPLINMIVIGTRAEENRVRVDALEAEFNNTPPSLYNQKLRTP